MEAAIQAQAAVVCHSSIMRSAIASSLEANGIGCTTEPERAKVAIIVSGLIQPPAPGQSFAQMPYISSIRPAHWIVLAHQEDDPIYRNLVEWGMDPCLVPEDIDGDDLSHVVRLASSGHVISLGRLCRHSHPDDVRRLNQARLSEDQWQLLGLLAEGLSNKEIAIRLDSTETAIKARLRCLLGKLDLSNRTKAAVMAARCGVRLREQGPADMNVVPLTSKSLRAA